MTSSQYIAQSFPLRSLSIFKPNKVMASCTTKSTIIDNIVHQRRNANYKPNIWKPNLLQSLANEYAEEEETKKEVKKLITEVRVVLIEGSEIEQVAKLEFIDSITKLGVANFFDKEIHKVLDDLLESSFIKTDLYATSLCFRLLRHYGYDISQDMFLDYVNNVDNFRSSNVKVLVELFEASNLGLENEKVLGKAREFSSESLKNLIIRTNLDDDNKLGKQLDQSLDVPLHWRVNWYNVRRHIQIHERDQVQGCRAIVNSSLVKLAKLNFNIVQSQHQKEIKEIISRWWEVSGITDKLRFSRDRIVESFLFTTGVACEVKHGNVRKCLAKVIQLILTIDDLYDIYGSLEELQAFTNAVEMWNPKEVNHQPECITTCFRILYDTTEEIAHDIQKEGHHRRFVIDYLRKAWADFCKALMIEAKWYNEGHTPSLEEYLSNGWISSSGPLLSIHVIFGIMSMELEEEAIHDFCETNHQIVYYISLIVRLTNDYQTTAVEQERGDASSSILCYMRDANVSEEVAREYIQRLIVETWYKINNYFFNLSQSQQQNINYIINIARVAHFLYQHGDGFGVQDREIREQVLINLFQPVEI